MPTMEVLPAAAMSEQLPTMEVLLPAAAMSEQADPNLVAAFGAQTEQLYKLLDVNIVQVIIMAGAFLATDLCWPSSRTH